MSDIGNNALDRRQDERRRRSNFSDEAAQGAFDYLRDNADAAAVAKAQVTYMANYVKIVKAQCMQESQSRSVAGQEADALCNPKYIKACEAERDAIAAYERYYWGRIRAQATIEAWQTHSANNRGTNRI